MGPAALAQVLRPLQGFFAREKFPELLAGLDDDAAVYQVADDLALIHTLDFFPPIVDDPKDFGAIAAANAMSDVYAMGGEVILALNVCCFPDELPMETLQEVLRGGAEKVAEAGAVLAGGHTVTDKELKYGLAVLGRVHPQRILSKSAARPGELLVLTKPIGTGITTTALKRGLLGPAELTPTVESMRRLNRTAARQLVEAGCRCCTDVTGFSVMGHALEIADHSGVSLRLEASRLPMVEGARTCAEKKAFPGGTFRNRDYYACRVRGAADAGLGENELLTLYSPETSGGLLATLPPEAASSHDFWVIGEVVPGKGIELRP
jgi:selenide,water dikinase